MNLSSHHLSTGFLKPVPVPDNHKLSNNGYVGTGATIPRQHHVRILTDFARQGRINPIKPRL